jgi:hypothetical protein
VRQPLSIRIHDATIGIWQDNPNDPTLRTDVYGELIRQMRARGWSVHQNPDVRRRHSCLSPTSRLGAWGTLRCGIRVNGRVVEVEFWSTTAPQINRHGRKYDFDKLRRMHPMDKRRLELEFRRITTWLETIAPVTVTRTIERDMAPMARIEKDYAESWHKDKALGRPHWRSDYNRQAKDGLLEQGQTVWMVDRKGRIFRGKAFYNLNNMWWVIAGGQLHSESCGSLYLSPPQDLRTKRNERARRGRLESELATAVQRMNYLRAETLKKILFGNEQTFMILNRPDGAFYRSNYSGYTTSEIHAGKYTRAEAEAECKRAPDKLEMVCPDGSRVRFDRSAA